MMVDDRKKMSRGICEVQVDSKEFHIKRKSPRLHGNLAESKSSNEVYIYISTGIKWCKMAQKK